MNINEYIESGVLESYIMGELSDEEMREVDYLAEKHPPIKQELEKIRTAVIAYGEATDQQPSANIPQAVLDTLRNQEKDVSTVSTGRQNALRNKIKRLPAWSVAASILLFISISFNMFFFWRLKNSREQIESLTSERTLLANQVETAKLKLDHAATRLAQFMSEDNILVRMDGLEISPQSYAHVFWNKKTNNIFISVDNLPEPPHGHQYQLWAIKPGQSPIDAGIFDHNERIQKLKIVKGSVTAFAVTLEKEGGTQNATVEKTYLKGFL